MPASDPTTIVPHGVPIRPRIQVGSALDAARQERQRRLAARTLQIPIDLAAGEAERLAERLAERQRRLALLRPEAPKAQLGIPAVFVTTAAAGAPAERGGGVTNAEDAAAAPAAGAERRAAERRARAPLRLRRRFDLQDTARALLRGAPQRAGRPRLVPVQLTSWWFNVRTRPPGRAYRGHAGGHLVDVRPHRIVHCHHTPAGGLVAVNYHAEHGSASYGGLQTCGSIWACPVCAAKIGARRSEEIAAGGAFWRRNGGHIYMLTLTLQHNAGMALYQLLNGLNTAYRKMMQGRMWSLFKQRLGLQGIITALEITHGSAGWHPHLHVLLFTTDDMGKQRYVNELWLAKRWRAQLAKLGLNADIEHGCDLRKADEGLEPYLTKLAGAWSIAGELAGGSEKSGRRGNRTAPQLLEAASRSSAAGGAGELAGALYCEYVAATRGVRWVRWSPNLRHLLCVGDELTDEQLAAEQREQAAALVVLTPPQWRWVRANALRGELLAQACSGDGEYVRAWLALQGLEIEPGQLNYHWKEGDP